MNTGECFPDNVFMVADAGQLQQQIDEIPAEGGVIMLAASNSNYDVMVPTGVTVAILGEPGSQWYGSNRALTVQTGAEVYVQSIRITNSNWGIEVNGELWLDRSEIINNYPGNIRVDGGSAIIRNSFVGGSDNNVYATYISSGTATISFTTLGVGTGTTSALRCTDGAGTTVRNSLLVSLGANNVVDCPNAAIADSALEMQAIGDNVVLGNVSASWFTGYASGDFHLSGTHPPEIETAAIWQPGDPLVDIDGDPRPQDQTPTVAGADLP